jgi:hypothetical protein
MLHVQTLLIMLHITTPSDRSRFKLTFGYHPRTPVGEIVEFVHPALVAFIEHLQSAPSFSRKCPIAALWKHKALMCDVIRCVQAWVALGPSHIKYYQGRNYYMYSNLAVKKCRC